MSDVSQGPGWWLASDGRWYPPEARPGTPMPPVPGYGAGYGPAQGYGQGPAGYGYGYAPAYGPHGTASGLPSVSGLATASMVLGILAIIPCWSLTWVFAVVSLPLGIVALRRISTGAADPAGRGQAVAGVVLSGISLVLIAVIIGFFVLGPVD